MSETFLYKTKSYDWRHDWLLNTHVPIEDSRAYEETWIYTPIKMAESISRNQFFFLNKNMQNTGVATQMIQNNFHKDVQWKESEDKSKWAKQWKDWPMVWAERQATEERPEVESPELKSAGARLNCWLQELNTRTPELTRQDRMNTLEGRTLETLMLESYKRKPKGREKSRQRKQSMRYQAVQITGLQNEKGEKEYLLK